MTCDSEGKPLKIIRITKFNKNLVSGATAAVMNEPAKVIRDPDEIALTLGEASKIDGVIVHKKRLPGSPMRAT